MHRNIIICECSKPFSPNGIHRYVLGLWCLTPFSTIFGGGNRRKLPTFLKSQINFITKCWIQPPSPYYIYTVRQKLITTWLVSIISFLIMNLFQIGLLFSLPVHTYLLTCGTGYWSIFIYVYMTGCVKCHVYFSTFVLRTKADFFCVEF